MATETAMKNYQSVRIPSDVLKMARIIVAVRGGQIGDLIGDTCRPVLKKIVKQLQDSGELTSDDEE